METLIRIALALALSAQLHAGAADEVRRLSAEPRVSAGIGEVRPRMDFDFGDIQAWLLADGSWHIEGTVRHRGALCGEYRLGIRFGAGAPGCANVNWIGEDEYGTWQRQCNNAIVRHVGGGDSAAGAREFAGITCAQRLIHCSGNCR